MKWINSNDKSPPNGTQVLAVVNDPDYNIINPLIDILTFSDGSYWCKYGSDMQFTMRVTHWMPLPEFPIDKQPDALKYTLYKCCQHFASPEINRITSELKNDFRKHDMDCSIFECVNLNCGGDFVPDKIVRKFFVATGKYCL